MGSARFLLPVRLRIIDAVEVEAIHLGIQIFPRTLVRIPSVQKTTGKLSWRIFAIEDFIPNCISQFLVGRGEVAYIVIPQCTGRIPVTYGGWNDDIEA